MANRQYNNTPIREAIFDVKFKFKNKLESKAFLKVHEEIKKDYPTKQINDVHFLSFKIGKDIKEPKVNSGIDSNGLRFISGDGTHIVQFRSDGFTFSKLAPYNGWEDFQREFKKMLSVYIQFSKPISVERVALRYINAITVPETNFLLEDYFLTGPKIGEGIPQGLLQFFSRLVIKDDSSESIAIINQTIEKNTKSNDTTTVILDVDIMQQNLSTKPDSKEFWDLVNNLKEFRTTVFEKSLTAKTKEIIS